MNTHYEHPEFGPIALRRTRRSRRITVTVRADERISLTYPYRTSLDEALAFLSTREEWVGRTLEKYRKITRKNLIPDGYSTCGYTLSYQPVNTPEPGYSLLDKTITVYHPLHLAPDDSTVRDVTLEGLERIWSAAGREYLPARLSILARELGFRYGKVTIRRAVSRWGSCSGKNDISLNYLLMKLPAHLIDYILIHELCHTVHKNHGPDFHKLLDEKTGGKHRTLQKELKGYHTRL